MADFLVQGGDEQLPQPGRLGLHLEDTADGVEVSDLVAEGAGEKAGVEKGDLIRSVDGHTVQDIVDLKLLLLDASPGDRVTLEVFRRNLIQNDEELKLTFPLGNEQDQPHIRK